MSTPNQSSVAASEIKTGQRVRVVLEDEVGSTAPGYFELGRRGDGTIIREDAEHVVSVEVLPDPGPEWQHGDVVLDGNGRVFLRLGGDRPQWRYLYQGASLGVAHTEVGHDIPIRPLTLLVHDDKPVQS